jgi:hypothetical protein
MDGGPRSRSGGRRSPAAFRREGRCAREASSLSGQPHRPSAGHRRGSRRALGVSRSRAPPYGFLPHEGGLVPFQRGTLHRPMRGKGCPPPRLAVRPSQQRQRVQVRGRTRAAAACAWAAAAVFCAPRWSSGSVPARPRRRSPATLSRASARMIPSLLLSASALPNPTSRKLRRTWCAGKAGTGPSECGPGGEGRLRPRGGRASPIGPSPPSAPPPAVASSVPFALARGVPDPLMRPLFKADRTERIGSKA